MVGNIERVGLCICVVANCNAMFRGQGASLYAYEIFVVKAVVELSYVRASLTRVLQYIEGFIKNYWSPQWGAVKQSILPTFECVLWKG